MDERRSAKRVPFKSDVLLNDAILVKGIDISQGGMYVHTGRSIPVGSRVRLQFMVLGRKVELDAEVKCCHESVGMGLQFVNPSAITTGILKSYVQGAGPQQQPVKKKVLLVGGAPAARRITKSKLVSEGYTVLEADNGAEGFKTAGSMDVDLVMLDMSLGDLDGFKALEGFRKDFPGTRVVVISPSGEKSVMEKAYSMGAAGFLTKMLASPVRVAETVKNVLSQK